MGNEQEQERGAGVPLTVQPGEGLDQGSIIQAPSGGGKCEDLIPVTMTLNTAVEAVMLILGALFIEVMGRVQDGEMFLSKQL